MTVESPDQDLVRAYAAEGSETAFGSLTQRYVNLVYGTAFRQVGDIGMAEEITQNVFVALARKAPRLAGVQTLAGWLHRTAILEAKTRIRTELRRRRREEVMVEMSELRQEGDSVLEAMKPMLDEGLLHLRESDRLALVLRFLEERSLREVGSVLGVDEDAARKRVARALERLSDFFRGRGFPATAGAGAAALFAGATQAAPVGLAVAAAQAGLAAGGAATGVNLLLLHFMNLTKTQLALACLFMAAVPLTLQHQALARMEVDQNRLAGQWVADQRRAEQLESAAQDVREANERARAELQSAEAQWAALGAQLQGKGPRPVYRWDDESPVVRVPKELVGRLPLSAVANKRGQLSDLIKEALQFSPAEAQQVQGALDQFLTDYYTAQATRVKAATLTADDLQGHAPEETRVFEVTALGEELAVLRTRLFAQLEESLGSQRFAIFRKALSDWMPVSDEYTGLNSGMGVFNFDHRVRFYRPLAGADSLAWGLARAGGQSMNVSYQFEEIPPFYRASLQDWIALAQRRTSANPGASN